MPVIEIDHLTFRYPKAAEPAVKGMTFAVGRGEVFGFLGPSGAGKSTTQKILIGLLTGQGGRVSVWGRDPADWGSAYYQRIGGLVYNAVLALALLRVVTGRRR